MKLPQYSNDLPNYILYSNFNHLVHVPIHPSTVDCIYIFWYKYLCPFVSNLYLHYDVSILDISYLQYFRMMVLFCIFCTTSTLDLYWLKMSRLYSLEIRQHIHYKYLYIYIFLLLSVWGTLKGKRDELWVETKS